MIDGEPPNDGTAVDGAGVDGAGPPNEVTSVVSIQRQRRLYRMAILRSRADNNRLARQHQLSQRQQLRREQDRQQHRRTYAEMSPEQLENRREQDRQQHRQARAEETPEQLEIRQEQDRDQHRRTRAAEGERITQAVNDLGETFSINMKGRPTANQLAGFEFDQDKALLLWYENSHDHVADLIQKMDDAAPGDEKHIAAQNLNNTLDEMNITPTVQRKIQQRFNSLHDRNALVIGCCCCGCTSILPTVSESGHTLPAPILTRFPTDLKFNPLKFTSEELNEFNDQHELIQQVRSSKAVNNGSERYHVHQELLRPINSEAVVNSNTESTSIIEDGFTITPINESNEVMEEASSDDPNFVVTEELALEESTITPNENDEAMEEASSDDSNLVVTSEELAMEESTITINESNESNEDASSDSNLVVPEEPALEGYICTKCDSQLSIGNIPTYSVAKLDFGLISRINDLPELTPIEKLLIARHRQLAVTLKLSPGGTEPDGFIGHIITFVHRGPETLLTTLPNVDDDLIDRITVHFIGRKNLPEDTNTFLRHVPAARVRPDLVIQYIQILKVIDPLYADLIIDNTSECLESMRLIPDRIFAERQVIEDAAIIQLDQIAVGNPAESIHQCSQDVLPQETMTDESNRNANIHPVCMESVFFNPTNGDASIAITCGRRELSECERVINSIRNIGEVLQGDSTDEQVVDERNMDDELQDESTDEQVMDERELTHLHNESIDDQVVDEESTDDQVVNERVLNNTSASRGRAELRVPRNQDPVNEFTSNDELFYAAFPITFPLGCGLRKPGSVPKKDALHMLTQHSRIVVKEPMVIFVLFNQNQRHSVVQLISAKVKADESAFRRFSEIVNAPNFQSRCDEAARHPNGTGAQQLLRDVLPLVRVGGAQVQFGPVQQARAACDLYANCRRFGLPTFFFTFAPDYRDPLVIRLGISKPIYSGFPYDDGKNEDGGGGYRDALHTWDINGRPCNTIFDTEYNITTANIQDIVRKNPTAQAIVYMSMMKAVFEGLLGISMDEDIKKSIPLSSRPIGIFGRTRAASMSTECQGRGTLHGHCLAWVELTPQVLQRLAGRDEFSDLISNILDTMVISSLKVVDHIKSVLTDKHPPVNVWRPDCNPESEQDKCEEYITSNMTATQIHSHSDTCKKSSKKSKHGEKKCRLAFKRVECEETKPIQLQLVTEVANDTDRHTVNTLEEISEWIREEPDWNVAGLYNQDCRIIYWATKRPLFQYSDIFNENGELQPDLVQSLTIHAETLHGDTVIDTDIVEKIGRLSDAEKHVFVENIIKRNCYVVETSPTAALLLCCNTNAQVLGASEQAKGVVQYLVNYVTKQSAQLAVVASLVAAARRHTIIYPSLAEDSNTPIREARYLITRLLNNISGMSEISTPQAAGSLMGLSPMTSTTLTKYCFIKGAMNYQQSIQNSLESDNDGHNILNNNDDHNILDNNDDDDGDSIIESSNDSDSIIESSDDDNYYDDDLLPMDVDNGIRQSVGNTIEDDDNNRQPIHQNQNEVNHINNEEYNDGFRLEGYSTAISNLVLDGYIREGTELNMSEGHERRGDEYASVYTINGVHTPIIPYTHYLYRGNELWNMNFVEYSCQIRIVKIPPGQVDNDGTTPTARRGRQSNKTFLFDERHPLYRLYRQQLCSKQATPIFAGHPPPAYPGDMTIPSTRVLRNEWKRFATYYLTAFCPWNVNTGRIPYTFDFRGFSDFVQTMARNDSFLDKARIFLMESTIRVLRLKQTNLIAITHYRYSNADKRVGNRFEGPCININDSNNTNNNEEDVDLVQLLDEIRAEARADDLTELTDSAGDRNAISVCEALKSVMNSSGFIWSPKILTTAKPLSF